jgi:multiple sugar transport system ATP-binding protein
MVFQSYALYPHMTVAENIAYPLRLRGVDGAERDRKVREAAALVHLAPFLNRYPGALSGGQKQRVAFARAIVRRPSVFLLDEPLSSLDPTLRGEMRGELKRLQAELGVTTIYVTHDQIEAMTLANRIAVINNGALAQLGTPRTIYDYPVNLFVAGFIGSPSMNLLRGALDKGTFVHAGGRVPIANAALNRAAVLAVRAEACRIGPPGSGHLSVEVHLTELIGDHTLVTAKVGDDSLVLKAPRDFAAPPGTRVGISIASGGVLLFDATTGARL